MLHVGSALAAKKSTLPPLFLLPLAVLISSALHVPGFTADLSGLIYRSKAPVDVSANGGTAWKPAKIGMGLSKNDLVRTGPGGSALILLDDGSFYHMKEKCQLEILDLAYDRQNKAMQSTFKIHKGKFLGRVSKLNAGSNANFKTPTALVAVRGTELSLDVADNGDTSVYLNEGRIVVTDFVTERGLPGDQRELLLDLIHETALKSREAAKVTSGGIRRERRSKVQIDASAAEFADLASEAAAAAREESALTSTESQARRNKSREEALK